MLWSDWPSFFLVCDPVDHFSSENVQSHCAYSTILGNPYQTLITEEPPWMKLLLQICWFSKQSIIGYKKQTDIHTCMSVHLCATLYSNNNHYNVLHFIYSTITVLSWNKGSLIFNMNRIGSFDICWMAPPQKKGLAAIYCIPFFKLHKNSVCFLCDHNIIEYDYHAILSSLIFKWVT